MRTLAGTYTWHFGNRSISSHLDETRDADEFAFDAIWIEPVEGFQPSNTSVTFGRFGLSPAPEAESAVTSSLTDNDGTLVQWTSSEATTSQTIVSSETSSGFSAQAVSDGEHLSMCGCAACLGNSDSDAAPQSVEHAGEPVASEPQLSGPELAFTAPTPYVGALLNEYELRWGGSAAVGSPVTVTFSFLASVPGYYAANADERDAFAPMNVLQQAAVREILQTYSQIANVTFVEVAGVGAITFGVADLGNGIAGWAYYPGFSGTSNQSAAGDVWITNRYASYANPIKGTWEYVAFVHEIGHALGLKHPGNYNAGGGGTGGPYLPSSTDSHQYTVMSYYSGPYYYAEPVTPQLYDVAAMQFLYGANTATRSGNDVYVTDASIRTIWDGGGSDVIDGRNYNGNQRIDLIAGNFSSVNGATYNLAIAYNVTIETALGGGGNDTLIANDFGSTLSGGGGNDTLVGGRGRDTFIGGSGADIFVFATGASGSLVGQRDLVSDFTNGVDRIDFSGFDAIAGTPALDPLVFLGASAFDGAAGELNYFFDSARGVTVLQGDTNGDRVADFAIDLSGNVALTVSNLVGVTVKTVIEASGSTSLTQVGNRFYLYNSSGSGPWLKYGGADALAGGAWTALGAEQTAGGYQVAWKAGNQYAVWNTDSSGNYLWNTNVVPGTDYSLQLLEVSFQQDLNGDGRTGPATSLIETFGVTDLAVVGNRIYMLNGSGTGPWLKYGGVDALAGGAWTAIGAEQTAGGYQVAWKAGNLYAVWYTDSSGNYLWNTNVMSAGDYALQQLETGFQQDLDGDGRTGVVTTVIESYGVTDLAVIGNRIYLLDGGGNGPSLKYGGAEVLTGGAWTAIGAEQTASGYQVAWKAGNLYAVWYTDSSGNYLWNSNVVSGGDYALELFETSFQQDLNGNGRAGLATSVIESSGVTDLTMIGNRLYLLDSGGSGPSLKFGGADFLTGSSPWTAIGAEQTASGYQVAWKYGNQYAIWNADSSGNYVSNTNVMSGGDAALALFEASFHQDLNGDGINAMMAALGNHLSGSNII